MKNNYEFSINSELYIKQNNDDIYSVIKKYFKEKLINNIIIITGPHLNKIGVASKIKDKIEREKLTVRLVYSEISQDGRSDIIEEIVKLSILNNCKGIIAVGGGSVLDIAKGVKLAYTSLTENIGSGGLDYVKKNREEKMSLLCIPTTAGTGSELTKVIVVKNEKTNRKEEIISEELLPDFTILTDDFIKTLPAKTTFTTLMDALTHAIEAMTSLEKNIISDSYAEESIKLILNNMDDIIENNEANLRIKSLIASSMAGIAFSNSMVGLVHAIAHALGAVLHIPHDLACSLMLTEVMKFNFDYAEDIFNGIFEIIDSKQQEYTKCSENLIKTIEDKINKYYKKFNISDNLNDYGLNFDNIEEIINKSYTDGARLTNIKPVIKEDIYNLLINKTKIKEE